MAEAWRIVSETPAAPPPAAGGWRVVREEPATVEQPPTTAMGDVGASVQTIPAPEQVTVTPPPVDYGAPTTAMGDVGGTLPATTAAPQAPPADPYQGPVGRAIGRVGSAFGQGWEGGQIFTEPMLREMNRAGPVGAFITNPLMRLTNGLLMAGAAIGRAGQQATVEALSPIDPRLGRDVASLADPFMGSPNMLRNPRVRGGRPVEYLDRNPLGASGAPVYRTDVGPIPPDPSIPQGRPMTPQAAAIEELRLADEARRRGQGGPPPPEPPQAPPPEPPPSGPPPGPGGGGPGTGEVPTMVVTPQGARMVTPEPVPGTALTVVPQEGGGSVGAARTPSTVAGLELTPQQIEGYRQTAEGNRLMSPPQPGLVTPVEEIPGVTTSIVERELTAEAARKLKALKADDPRLVDVEKQTADANNTAYTDYFDDTSGSPTTLANARRARDDMAAKMRAQIWKNQQPTDIQPVLQVAEGILNSPAGRVEAVEKAVQRAVDRLTDRQGNLIDNPETLYGVRRNINALIDERVGGTRVNALAVDQLIELRDALDVAIEGGAKGFKEYLAFYADASARINEMEALQGYRNSLFDSAGRIQPARVQKMMRDITDARNLPGAIPEKHISPETLERLWTLRDRLWRKQLADDLGRAPGSDTAQTLLDVAKTVGIPAAIGTAATAVAGPIAGMVAGAGTRMIMQQGGAARRFKQGEAMINPPRNDLLPPPPQP